MKEIFQELIQNKNFLMFMTTVVYVLGLFAYFTENPVLLAGIFTSAIVILLIKNFPVKTALIWVVIFYTGFLNASFRIKNYDDLFKLAPADAVITGQIVSVPNGSSKHNSKFFFNVKKVEVNGNVYNYSKEKTFVGINDYTKTPDFSNLIIGNTYEIKGKLRRPFISTNPSQFSYADYLKNFRVYTTFYANNTDIKQIPNEKISLKWRIVQYLNIKRNNVIATHSKYINSPYLDILGGVIFGDDAISPPDFIKTSFIHSGLLHILAASGLNVAFISAFLFFFMNFLKVPFKLQMIIGIISTIFYCFMTGLGASVIRAGLMLIFVFFGKFMDRDAHSVSLLSFVGMLMLIYNPAYINDVGFQLSFIVTLGILLTADAISKYIENIPKWLSSTIFIPVIAQLWVIPIQMFYFNTISLYSVLANILTMPFLWVISCGGFISSIFALYQPIADFVCKWFDIVLSPCLVVLVYISDMFAKLPHSLLTTTHPNICQILLYYIILAGIIYLIKTGFQNKKLGITTLCLAILLVLSATIHLPDKNCEIISFDVGNADAFLIKSPKNKYFIIDTGKMGYNGSRSQADIIILKYLKDRGIRNIEGLIITHFDSDHAGGAVDLIRSLRIKKVYVNNLNENKRLAKEIYKISNHKQNTKLLLPKEGEIICSETDFTIQSLKANIPQHGKDAEANENSLITLVKNKDMTMLFTGDSGIRAFNELKPKLPQNLTVLKVGHHGAKDVINKEMVNYFNPKASLVSVGYNKYGHPHPLTIKLLSDTKVLRTDKLHAIKIISKPKVCEIDGYDSKTKKFYKKYELK